jgi:hypothetical protein
VIPLRPLGVGEVLDGAITYIRMNPVATLGISALAITITELFQVPLTKIALDQVRVALPSATARPTVDDLAQATAGTGIAALVSGFVTLIGITVLSGILVVVLSQAVLGRTMRLGAAWRVAKGRLPGMLGISLLSLLGIAAVVALGFVPLVLALAAGAPGAVAVILGVIGIPVSWVAAIYLYVAWSMIGPVYVLERVPAMAAFGRSRKLVQPQWWRVFGILLLGALIAAVINGIAAVPFSFLSGAFGNALSPDADPFAGFTTTSLVLSALGGIIGSTLTAPFRAGVTGLLYFDQRIRREAFDIELTRATQ